MQYLYAREFQFILGPDHNEFGYHMAETSYFFSQKRTLMIDINVQKVRFQ